MTLPDRPAPRDAALEILATRFPSAAAMFLAGSVVRGEATAYSDLDLVVVVSHCDHAHRESFVHAGWPVEAFVHDPETLAYFWDVDRAAGVPSLLAMVHDGIELPAPSALTARLKSEARRLLAAGPPPLSEEDREQRRYAITDLLDDLRAPRSRDEAYATGAALYHSLADYALRAGDRWSARGKSIPRRLATEDPALAARFTAAFAALFREGRVDAVLALAEDELRPTGGLVFAGFRRNAPAAWRRPLP